MKLLLEYAEVAATEEAAVKMLARVLECRWLDDEQVWHMKELKAELDSIFKRLVEEIADRDMSDIV